MRIRRSLISASALLASLVFSVSPAVACGGFEFFTPAERSTHSTDDTQVFIRWEEGMQTTIVKPEFNGNATDFGMILPFPSKPMVKEIESTFFEKVNALTAPENDMELKDGAFMATAPGTGSGTQSGVTVIERTNIGDYEAVTLTASSATGLVTWLQDNGFDFSERDRGNIDYYIQKKGVYFVAVKVALPPSNEKPEDLEVKGSLEPLGFQFATDHPVISMRISASDHSAMDFRLYVAASQMYFIPGTKIEYSKRLLKKDITSYSDLEPYVVQDDWITRMKVTMDPSIIEEDLELVTTLAPLTVTKASEITILNRESMNTKNGVVIGESTARFLSTSLVDPNLLRATPTAIPRPTNPAKPSPVPEITIAFKNQKILEPEPWYRSRSLWILLATSAVVEICLGFILYTQIKKHEDKNAGQ